MTEQDTALYALHKLHKDVQALKETIEKQASEKQPQEKQPDVLPLAEACYFLAGYAMPPYFHDINSDLVARADAWEEFFRCQDWMDVRHQGTD